MKDLERQFEEENKKIQVETEPEVIQDQDEDDQGNWEEYDEDAWSRWHCEDERTGKEESSKESSFVVISQAKGISSEAADSPSKGEKSGDQDIMEAFKLVIENGRKTVEMIIDAQKEKSISEEDKLDQEDQRMKFVELEKLEEPTEESAAIICGDWMHRVRPVIKNLSKRSSRYWQRLEKNR